MEEQERIRVILPGASLRSCRAQTIGLCLFLKSCQVRVVDRVRARAGTWRLGLDLGIFSKYFPHSTAECFQLYRIQTFQLTGLCCQVTIPDKLAQSNLLCL